MFAICMYNDNAVTMALRAKNKPGFVDGSLTTQKKKDILRLAMQQFSCKLDSEFSFN
jgi:hypothetical protein